MLLTGAEILIKTLIDEGVETVFGYPGGAVLNIYDELYKYSKDINHVLTCHEQNAAHAADGYARSTGKVGVCIATSGPGATNLVTGIATAYMDSVPMVAITGNVATPLLGKDSFQEVDIRGITMPVTKHNYIVEDVKDLQDIVREAFYIAKEGRPGPVLIDIPKDITANKAHYEKKKSREVEKYTKYITDKSIEEAVRLINESKRPFIYAGGGIIHSGASDELLKFAEKINSPVSSSLMALGGFPEEHELFTGMIGMHGTKASNICVIESDLIIVLGARFSDRVISSQEHIPAQTKILHIDIDSAEVNKNIKADACVIGDLKIVLEKLNALIKPAKNEEWLKRKDYLKKLTRVSNVRGDIHPKFLLDKVHEIGKDNLIISTEVGQHQMWTAQYYKFNKPRTFLTSGGLGTMGYGLGACIGAQVGNPNKRVINIAGDGSFGMNCNEIATAVSQNLPVILIIINNNALGMVRQWQSLFYNARFSQTTLNRKTDIVKLAEAFGATGFRIIKKDDVEKVLKKAFECTGPVVIDCLIDHDINVFPMVAPGAPINQIITEETLD
jgi:acetolactate synthase-1/2/3 large subunit